MYLLGAGIALRIESARQGEHIERTRRHTHTAAFTFLFVDPYRSFYLCHDRAIIYRFIAKV
jgi:hypothetical protein